MKRDLDLLRSMMLRIEELDSHKHKITIESFSDLCEDPYMISLHIDLMQDENFIEILDEIYCGDLKDFIIARLTTAGYDYIDAIYDDSIWFKTKEQLQTIGGRTALSVVKNVAVTIAEYYLKSKLPSS